MTSTPLWWCIACGDVAAELPDFTVRECYFTALPVVTESVVVDRGRVVSATRYPGDARALRAESRARGASKSYPHVLECDRLIQ
jgi:hypothetical protein